MPSEGRHTNFKAAKLRSVIKRSSKLEEFKEELHLKDEGPVGAGRRSSDPSSSNWETCEVSADISVHRVKFSDLYFCNNFLVLLSQQTCSQQNNLQANWDFTFNLPLVRYIIDIDYVMS